MAPKKPTTKQAVWGVIIAGVIAGAGTLWAQFDALVSMLAKDKIELAVLKAERAAQEKCHVALDDKNVALKILSKDYDDLARICRSIKACAKRAAADSD